MKYYKKGDSFNGIEIADIKLSRYLQGVVVEIYFIDESVKVLFLNRQRVNLTKDEDLWGVPYIMIPDGNEYHDPTFGVRSDYKVKDLKEAHGQ